MRVSTSRVAWIGLGLTIGLAGLCGADETPKILVTPFHGARAATALRAPNLEARLAARIETVAGGRARAVLDASGNSNARLEANELRTLAAAAGAAYVLVGEWLPAESSADAARVLEAAVELRSGHSGATEHRYRLSWDSSAGAAGADSMEELEVERVARAMLQDLQIFPEPAGPAPVAAPADAAQLSNQDATQNTATKDSEKEGGKRTDFLTLSRDQPIEISSDELELLAEGDTKHLIFSDHVLVVQGEMRLFAGYLEAFYPDGASQPDRLRARQNVRMSEGDLEVRCREVTYLRDEGLVICRGDALLVQGCDEVRGQEIVFHLDQERVKVTGAASVVLRLDQDDPSNCGLGGRG